jgi:thiamine-monophosphate kinase
MVTERSFIRNLNQQFRAHWPVTTGIGDDGAVIDCSVASQQIVVTDMLLDGVHFDLQHVSARLAGRKAVAVNLSDLAAMACQPTAAFISIAIPRRYWQSEEFVSELYEGIQELADQYEFTIAGGDTNSWDGPFVINVCLTGVPMGKQPALRSGAQPADWLLVSGPLGGSLASGRHLTFEPRLALAEWLVEHTQVNALMDISDGLAIDLHRMLEASNAGAEVIADNIPIHADVPQHLEDHVRRRHALSDGEDFELLIAISPDRARSLLSNPPPHVTLHHVGTITKEPGCHLVLPDGERTVLEAAGWEH